MISQIPLIICFSSFYYCR